MAAPDFIEIDSDKIISEIKADFEARLGKPIQPAQPEMLIINAMAYREVLLRSQIQSACLSMLVDYSTGLLLDSLAVLVGVFRIAPTSAECTFTIVLEDDHTGVTIPAGYRAQSKDGKVIFVSLVEKVVNTGVTEVSVDAECTTVGVVGNGYLAGDISVQLDPLPYVISVENDGTTGAGSDQETDEELRERIRLAPNSYSSAGPSLAYKFWAKTASALIIDVAVVTITAGQTNIYPLVADGSVTPDEVIEAVENILTGEKIRPHNDTVVVLSPTRINYTLDVELTILPDAVESEVIAKVRAALEAYTVKKRQTLGRDIVADQVKSLCIIPDEVYSVDLGSFTDIVVGATEFAYCTDIDIVVVGTNEG